MQARLAYPALSQQAGFGAESYEYIDASAYLGTYCLNH